MIKNQKSTKAPLIEHRQKPASVIGTLRGQGQRLTSTQRT